jgi:hypothetical protein
MERSLSAVDALISRSKILATMVDGIASRFLPREDATALLCGQSYWHCGDACWNCNCPGCGFCWGFNCANHVYATSYNNCIYGSYYSYTCFGCCT